jgi:hypothetical protein
MFHRPRDLCREGLAWFVQAGLMPSYEESGRFVTPTVLGGPNGLDARGRMLIHYSVCRGELYRNRNRWRLAHDLIALYKADRDNWSPVWKLDDAFGGFAVSPLDLLQHVSSAMTSLGVACRNRDDISLTAVHAAEETLTAVELPEPFGKWYQSQGKPMWEQPLDLSFEIECEVTSTLEPRIAPTSRGEASVVNIRCSACAPQLLIALHKQLGRALPLEKAVRPDTARGFSAYVTDSAQQYLREFD